MVVSSQTLVYASACACQERKSKRQKRVSIRRELYPSESPIFREARYALPFDPGKWVTCEGGMQRIQTKVRTHETKRRLRLRLRHNYASLISKTITVRLLLLPASQPLIQGAVAPSSVAARTALGESCIYNLLCLRKTISNQRGYS